MLFSMSDFPQFITTFICCVKQMRDEIGTDFLSTFFTFDLNFRNFKDWITFRSDILDGSLSRTIWFIYSRWFSIEVSIETNSMGKLKLQLVCGEL